MNATLEQRMFNSNRFTHDCGISRRHSAQTAGGARPGRTVLFMIISMLLILCAKTAAADSLPVMDDFRMGMSKKQVEDIAYRKYGMTLHTYGFVPNYVQSEARPTGAGIGAGYKLPGVDGCQFKIGNKRVDSIVLYFADGVLFQARFYDRNTTSANMANRLIRRFGGDVVEFKSRHQCYVGDTQDFFIRMIMPSPSMSGGGSTVHYFDKKNDRILDVKLRHFIEMRKNSR